MNFNYPNGPTDMSITQRNLSCYDLPPIEWERVRTTLATDVTQAPDTGGPNRHTSWLTTINPDGAPHVRPLGIVQVDGVWYFNSGPATASRGTSPPIRGASSVSRLIRSTWCSRATPNVSRTAPN